MFFSNKGDLTRIFRIVHYKSLKLIIQNGLIAPNSPNASSNYITIGNPKLISDRGTELVPAEAEGNTLNDYIPFYFAPRSPMLYLISLGRTPFKGPQKEIIHLVSNIQEILKVTSSFLFTKQHAKTKFREFYFDLADLSNIDWPLMNNDIWKNTEVDNNRMHRRMAEFLVYNRIPISCILEIGVMTNDIKIKVESILENSNISIPVCIKRIWYY